MGFIIAIICICSVLLYVWGAYRGLEPPRLYQPFNLEVHREFLKEMASNRRQYLKWKYGLRDKGRAADYDEFMKEYQYGRHGRP